jgi:hypothetical protein
MVELSVPHRLAPARSAAAIKLQEASADILGGVSHTALGRENSMTGKNFYRRRTGEITLALLFTALGRQSRKKELAAPSYSATATTSP